MPYTIAIADDEPHLLEAVAEYLSMQGYVVFPAADAAAFRRIAAAEHIDVAILDIAMPGEDGLSLARWLRRNSAAGIIFASASGSPLDRIVGLEIGADDYLSKPYDLRELLARVRSLIRRMGQGVAPMAAPPARDPAPAAQTPGQTPVDRRNPGFGPYVVDLAARRLARRDQGPVPDLSPAEFDLLEVLASRPNRILSRGQIAELLGAGDSGDGGRHIDVRITRLRRKIEADHDNPRFIRTVRGEGYVLIGEGG